MPEYGQSFGIFARNWRHYLQSAAETTERDSRDWTTFRSKLRWTSAKKHVGAPIYFAVIDEEPVVKFEAELASVVLDPDVSDPKTRNLLRFQPASTRDEGLWKGAVKTLYAVENCRPVSEPFPLSELILYSEARPLSGNFRYSYALVRRRR